ncbi:MAG: hypothetical protein QNJ46_20705 [Leptolyngbyaceae cyanobacterium MO_188.B28]|nr:hypothetical protein [Leptolyngbyaceae cyanobacterium MO_188.B28]
MTTNLPGVKAVSPPPLESGDRLSRSEFGRRYATTDIEKADFREKIVISSEWCSEIYIVWQVYENKRNWYFLDDGVYQSLPPDKAGIIWVQLV